MPIVFLVPAFLAGLAALAVPIVLHLRRRERERPMRFPSLMFLRKIPFATARRRRITDLPLLLLRALILVLAVAAFARPFLRPRADAASARRAGRVVLAIDRSMSMGHTAVWQAARDSAHAVLARLAADDKVAIVAFDDEATLLQPLTTDHAAARAALDAVTPGTRGTRYPVGLRAASEALARDPTLGGEIVVVTDLQRSGSGGVAGLSLPSNVSVRVVAASHGVHGNTGIFGVDVQRLPGNDRGRLAAVARVATRGLTRPRTTHLRLTLNGREATTREATLAPDGIQNVAFDPVPLPAGAVRITVVADPDSLAGDDSFSAVVPPDAARRILLVSSSDAASGETFYFERATETGRNPSLKVDRVLPSAVTAATLRDAAAVVLFDVAIPSGNAGAAVLGYVRAGGGVVVVAGPQLSGRGGTNPLLPGSVHEMVERRDERGGILGDASLDSPVFAAFRSGGAAALGAIHFFRYPRIVPSGDAVVLARFDDGLPALVERSEGEGRVLLDAAPLDATSGDFPLQPAYLPYLRNLLLYAAGHSAPPLWRTTGDGYLLPLAVQSPVVRTPDGDILRPVTTTNRAAITFATAGFYSIYEGRPSGDPLAVVAVNPPARESDLTPMDPRELLVGVGVDSVAVSPQDPAAQAVAEGRQRLWRLLLLLAALALVLETVIANRGWRGVAADVVGAGLERSQR